VRPLHAVALGLVVVAIYARAGEYDLLPDPIGWLLVLLGLKALTSRVDVPLQGIAWVLGALAVLASAALSVPDVFDWFEDADPALRWAMDVPALAFCAVLCHGLAQTARAARATAAAAWFQWTAIGFCLSVLAPVIVIGGGVDSLRGTFEVATGLAQLALFVLCLSYAGREWAGAPEPEDAVT
jgi:hypothetical protein